MQTASLKVRFFCIGKTDPALVHNLVYTLTSVQDFYVFDICRESIELNISPDQDGKYDDDELTTRMMREARERYPGEYPLFVCNVPLRGDISASFEEDGALLSTFNWHSDYATYSFERIASFYLVDILLTRRVTTPVHTGELRACPSDSFETPEDRQCAMEKGDFCRDCKLILRRGVNSGMMSTKELSAIYRILDWIANRKRAFVIMPFGGAFDLIYKNYIKAVLAEEGWTPVRVDENADSAEITDLIKEEIYRARVIVADLTARNANVFYELGFAHALELPGILLIQNIAEVPFDVRQWRLIQYSMDDTEKLRKQLKSAISMF